MKKKFILATVFVMLCMLCGCLEATPLTDSEMDAVAEYASSLLLKYDKNYRTPLYYAEERETKLTPTPTPLPVPENPTATPTPTPSQSTTPENTPSVNPTAGATATPTPTPTPVPNRYDDEETGRQLTEIMGAENITVSCTGFEIMKSVQSTEYFSLVAKEGRQYVVVSFRLSNSTEKDLVFDASGSGLEYSLDINTGKVSRVSLSMLENDLQYMEIPVPAKGTADAVLVFEIADEEINTIHLIIKNESEDSVFAKLK